MTQRNLEEIQSLLRGLPLGTSYEILSQDEPNNEEAFHEVDDIQDADEDTAQGPSHSQLVIRGRNNYRWYTNNSEIPVQHVSQIYFAKPNGDAMNIKTPLEAWSLLFPNNLLEIIVRHTNEEIRRRAEYQNEDLHRETNLVELKALLGLLYFTGLRKRIWQTSEHTVKKIGRVEIRKFSCEEGNTGKQRGSDVYDVNGKIIGASSPAASNIGRMGKGQDQPKDKIV
ncbi:uncharacterized protein LOC107218646 isoform X2 [Neodiprion lecontei]|uniref:Uncharacterized protein LOC107218646 isoform X2 n=1 Tax=Neodiprion lecontei TaxID=441921 RepID=A0ABM3FMQ8_NEOLC|nr:uncharacterized protein LOC107218646 isoform X2 [Neodiprion lecontei]